MKKLTLLLTTALLLLSTIGFSQTWIISGPSSACAGDQDVYYNIESTTGGLPPFGLYNWTLNGTFIGRGSAIYVDFPASGTNYSLVVSGSINTSKTISNNGLADPGTISLTSSACASNQIVDASGHSGSLKWQVRVGAGAWADYGLGFTEPLGYSVTAGTQYQFRIRTNTPCATQYSNTVTVTPLSATNAGNVSSSQTICSGQTPASLNASAASGGDGSYSYQWKKKVGSGSWQNITGSASTLTSAQIGTLTQTTQFKQTVTDGTCGSDDSNVVTISIYPNLGAGSIGNAQTVCYNGNPNSLTSTAPASGGNGSISYQWQYSTNGSSGWTNLSGQTNTTYDPQALTSSRWYRRRAISCNQTKYTNSVKITVHPTLSGGSIGNAQTLCYNGNASSLTNIATASGGDGSYAYQWQSSTTGTSGWTNLSGQTNTVYNPPALTSSRWYRRRATSCGETKYSNTIKITIHPALNSGSIGNAQTLCYNGNASSLTSTAPASGGDGSYSYQWQYSTNGTNGWTNLSGQTNTTYNPPALTSNRWYRRRAISCGQTKYTNKIKITIHPTLNPGSIGSNQTICYNDNPFTLSNSSAASGGNGSVNYQWQYSTNGTSGWTDVNGQTNTTYDPPALTADRWYRREAVSCGETKYTNSIKITVLPTLSPGSVGNAQTLCYGENPSALTNGSLASGGNGSFNYQWQYSTNGTNGWTDLSGETGTTYDPPALTSSRWYRRSAYSCYETKYTNTIKITIHPTLNPGSIGNAQTLCYNGNASVLTNTSAASGGDGSYSYQWQYSTNGTSGWTNLSGQTNTTYNPPALTSSRWYRREAVSCGETKHTNSIKITIHPTLNPGSIGNAQTLCYNENASALTNNSPASGGNGSIGYQWQYSNNGTSGWTNLSGETNTTYDPPALTTDRWYRREAVSCGETKNTNVIKITVHPTLAPGSIGNAQTLCFNENPSALTSISLANGGNGNINYQWQYSTNGTNGWTDLSGETGTTYDPPNLTSNRWYRRSAYSCNETKFTNVIAIDIHPDLFAGSINGVQTICANTSPSLLNNVALASGGGSGLSYQWQESTNGSSWVDIVGETVSTYQPGTLASSRWFRRGAYTNDCSVEYTSSVKVSVDASTNSGTLSSSADFFGTATGTLYLNGETGAILQWETKTTGSWQPIVNTDDSFNYMNLIEPTYYRVKVQNGSCAVEYSNEVIIDVVDEPSINVVLATEVRPGIGTNLSTDAGHDSYVWYRDGIPITGETNYQLMVTHPGIYKVQVTHGTATFTTEEISIGTQLEPDQNYIITYDFRNAGYSGSVDIYSLDKEEVTISVDILDGLGRPQQKITVESSPLGNDMVAPIEYDEYGRVVKNYLPFASTDKTTLYKANALNAIYLNSDQYAFYNALKGTSVPFSETSFEASPLNRVMEQGSGGEGWQIGENTKTIDYAFNQAQEVIQWDYDNLLTMSASDYSSNQLTKVTTTDEDGNPTIEFQNNQGQILLKKSQVDGTTWAQTYYIYDDYGQLRVVIPPEASNRLDTEFFAQGANRQSFLDLWAFQYDYDDRNRMTMKKVPGAEKVLMVYDQWDRLVLTQDGNQRAAITPEWSFTKYDALNRPIMTGIISSSDGESTIRSNVGAETDKNETFSASGINQYTDVTYPSDALVTKYLTVTYYDNYNYLPHVDWNTLGFTFDDPENPDELVQNTEVIGQVTGTMTKAGDGSWIRSVSYYDDKYRPIQTQSTSHLGGRDVATSYYDFIGQVTKTINSHDNGTDATTITKTFEYDHAGRLLKAWHQLNAAAAVQIVENNYNELGELVEKELHGGEQSVDYAYNIRGWLTKINNGTSFDDVSDMFGMELQYNQAGRYNGNIGQMNWKSSASMIDDDQTYTFQYDGLNRLKKALYTGLNRNDHYSVYGTDTGSTILYDLNGNIMNLRRNFADDMVDDLIYTYEGNQLHRVADNESNDKGFDESNAEGALVDEYFYDANGNMIKDLNKGIESIDYNHLNLPIKVTFDASNYIVYQYDAAGIKLQQKVTEGGSVVKITDYVGEFIYETTGTGSRALELIQHEEGRIIPQYGGQPEALEGWDYQYHLKDHLGNVRLTFSTTPENFTMVETFETGETNGFEDLHRHTNSNANTTTGGDEVERLQAGQTGAMVFLSLNKGDTVNLSVQANYESAPSGNTFLGTAYNALFTSFDNVYGGAEGVTSTSSDFNDALSSTDMAGKSGSSTAPRAFLNYIFFDTDMNYVNAGFTQVTTAAQGVGVHETVTLDVPVADREGYVLAYLSNENTEAVDLHFDDFTVYHGKTNVVQSDNYYPFGLTYGSYQRTASTRNFMNTFQDQEYDEETGWAQFKWRNHQPEIGRFFNVDPLAEDYYHNSPYAFSENKVVVHIELEGLESLYVFDQENRPADNGTAGTTYTADIYVVHDNGNVEGPYSGSSYPNSVSNSDNSPAANTVNEGTHNFSNQFGHSGGDKKGLNLGQGDVSTHDQRTVPGTTPSGESTDVEFANVHVGVSDNGNSDSRGSQGCITVCPTDADGFFGNFDFSGGNTGNASGTISIFRGDSDASNAAKFEVEFKQTDTFKQMMNPTTPSDQTRRVNVPKIL